MSREYFFWTDEFPTVTVLLSSTVSAEGKTWRGYIPFNDLYFDDRADQRVLAAFPLAHRFGDDNGPPEGVSLRILGDSYLAAHDANFDPRKLVMPGVFIELKVSDSAPAFTDIPLTLLILGIATDAGNVNTITLPTYDTNTSEISVKDSQAGALDTFWEIIASGDGGAATSSHNHTNAAGDGGPLTNELHDGYSQYAYIATPSSPPAGQVRIYPKSDGNFYKKTPDGVETKLGSGGGGDARTGWLLG